MAGLGECCSHVAGTLFACESAVSILKNKSCTDVKQNWHQCALQPSLQFRRVCDLDFSNPATKKKETFTADVDVNAHKLKVKTALIDKADEFYA